MEVGKVGEEKDKGRGQEGEMTQTMHAPVNKLIIKKEKLFKKEVNIVILTGRDHYGKGTRK
jgi:hypothetical protein